MSLLGHIVWRMIPIVAAMAGALVGFALNFFFNFWWRRRDERHERWLELYRDQIPRVQDELQLYVNTNVTQQWLAISETEQLERSLRGLYSTAAITGTREAAQCRIFAELADELQRMRLLGEYQQDLPRFVREGGRAKRNRDYAAQAALAADGFLAWVGKQLLRRPFRSNSTRLRYIEIDRAKAGDDLSRFDEPEFIDAPALGVLLGNVLLDCRVVGGSPLPGATFDLRLSRDATDDLIAARWAEVVDVRKLPDGSTVARLWTLRDTRLGDNFRTAAFDDVGDPGGERYSAEWYSA
ncbi:hypothetical protein [Gordonia sp. (in: high G+C Gram-positive bacteria)]|uniref:hypothetical protein n=1 Tax=Gordonia sp. (in: high G+C Gram-positive bacteria) TaxID=84139 RepID=UPI003C790BA9